MNPLFLNALIGGALIGLAALIFSGVLGRVMGVSGIIKWLLPHRESDSIWRITFVIGLLCGVGLYQYLTPSATITLVSHNPLIAIIAGLLVGVGVSLANGCTSGHSICGIGRLSFRSMVATILFVITGIVTVTVMQLF